MNGIAKPPETIIEPCYEHGLELLRTQDFFGAHEAFEEAWRAAAPGERDFFQGLVHVAVAWYQGGRGKRIGCERQLEKAARRLEAFAPAHRGLDVSDLLDQVTAARGRFPSLPPLTLAADSQSKLRSSSSSRFSSSGSRGGPAAGAASAGG